jgi:hypothetical protein
MAFIVSSRGTLIVLGNGIATHRRRPSARLHDRKSIVIFVRDQPERKSTINSTGLAASYA